MESEEYQRARGVLLSMMPSNEAYQFASPDMVAGLIRRDFKWLYAVTPELVQELGDSLLPTTLVPLSFAEGVALKFCHIEDLESELGPHKHSIQSILEKLEVEIEKAGKQSSDKRVFVKLSFMSPKDVALRLSNTQSTSAFRRGLEVLLSSYPNSKELIQAVIDGEIVSKEERDFSVALYRTWLDSLYGSLSITTAKEALKKICASSRCYEELNDALIFPKQPELFRTCIVVRPWISIKPGFEFRVFVSDSKITAAGQYEPVYYPEVWKKREWLEKEIRSFVNTKVIPSICHRLPSVTVDIVMTEDDKLYVCEINPFATSTSGCMFKWDTDRVTFMVGPETWRFAGPGESKINALPQDWVQFVAKEVAKKRSREVERWLMVASATVVAMAVGYYCIKQ